MDILCVLILEREVNLKLDPGSYTFLVSAFTSKGGGDNSTYIMDIKSCMYEDI